MEKRLEATIIPDFIKEKNPGWWIIGNWVIKQKLSKYKENRRINKETNIKKGGNVKEKDESRGGKGKQEEKHKHCRLSLLCEAASPPAVFVSLSLPLSLHSRFKLKTGSLKGRNFKCAGLQAHPATKHNIAQRRRDGESLAESEWAKVAAVWRDIVCFWFLLSMLEATQEAETMSSWVTTDLWLLQAALHHPALPVKLSYLTPSYLLKVSTTPCGWRLQNIF